MTRQELERYILDTYPAQEDRPWLEYPGHQVFRHTGNKKWFALAMTLTRDKLGLPGEGLVDAVNLKCDPRLVPTLLGEPGFLPAYHMNKTHWITARLDGTAQEEKILFVLGMSYDLTKPKREGRHIGPDGAATGQKQAKDRRA